MLGPIIRTCIFLPLLLFAACSDRTDNGAPTSEKPVWPPEVREVSVACSYDGTNQAALFWSPKAGGPHPLLVALHTWSGDYRQIESLNYFQWCREHDWIFIHPNFRGPNFDPGACASEAAVNDVLDAVEYAKKNALVDPRRVYLIGTSGGGHMTLIMAGRAPETWTAASAWVPISDLAAWHAQCSAPDNPNSGYAKHMEAVCGGAPGSSPSADSSYGRRSPLTWLAAASGLPLDLNAGIHDGHSGSVPVSHSLEAFNLLAGANGYPEKTIPLDLVERFVTEERVPAELAHEAPQDSLFSEQPVLFRREAGAARVTIFEGAHEAVYRAGLAWLARQVK